MLYNTHCHVFNLQSVFTDRTREVLRKRLAKTLGDELADKLADFAAWVVERNRGLKKDETIEDVLREMGDRVSGRGGMEPLGLDDSVLDVMKRVSRKAERTWLNRLVDYIRGWFDPGMVSASDIKRFLDTSLLKYIDEVTDKQFKEIHIFRDESGLKEHEAAIVPMMMDFPTRNPDLEEACLDRFKKHCEDMRRQVLRYPGRVLPFFKYNPSRRKVDEVFDRAVKEGWCVGIKVYPSLGHHPDEGAFDHAWEVSVKQEMPVMTHCNDAGFGDADWYDLADPELWRDLMKDGKVHKVCFGHFGGEELFRPGTRDAAWHATILGFMNDVKMADKVYADISYHSTAMKRRTKKKYFTALSAALNAHPDKILWGTDFFLALLQVREQMHWKWFHRHLPGKETFLRCAESNPPEFLGIRPGKPLEEQGENIRNHVKFIRKNRDASLEMMEPPEWLKGYLE